MNPKTLGSLAIAAVAALGAALAATMLDSKNAPPTMPERLFEDLRSHLNDVATIRIEEPGGTIEIDRAPTGWGVASKEGYPARYEAVKSLLVGLSELQPRARKTADPNLYDRVGVGDPDEGGSGQVVTLLDEDGNTLVSVILGTRQGDARFVRPRAERQSWLVGGSVDAWTDPMRWVDRQILRLPGERLSRVTITHADGSVLSMSKQGTPPAFAIDSMPEGLELKTPAELNRVTNALLYLDFTDVRAAGDSTLELTDEVSAEFRTSDGLIVTVHTWDAGEADGVWAEIEVDADSSVEESAESVIAEAREISTKAEGWLYQLNPTKARSLRVSLEDLTKPRSEDPAENDEG